MNPITLSVIIPIYNEEKRIKETLNKISIFLRSQKIDFEIIAVTNNCTDNTVQIVNQIKKESIPEIIVIDIPRKGLVGNMKGYAIGVGMRQASGLFHIFIDADNATPFEQVVYFMDYINKGYDVVVGSRYVKGANVVKKQPLHRVLISRLGNIIIRVLLLPGIFDTQCGFKMFNKNASNIIFSKTTLSGWGADLEMLAIARIFGLKIKEAPVIWEAQGDSAVRSHAFLYTLKELFVIRKNVKSGFYKK